MSKTKWYQKAVYLLVALSLVLSFSVAPMVPQGSPLSNVGPGVAQAQVANVVNITSPTANNTVCVQPGGSLTVNWTYNTSNANCTSTPFSIRVYNGTTVIFENTAVNKTVTPGTETALNHTFAINASAPANCNYYNLTIIAGCPVLSTPPEDTEVNAIFVDNVTPTVDLTAPSGDICIHENNVTVSANVSDDCCLANVTFWYNIGGGSWNFIGYNNTSCSANTTCTRSVVWDTSSLVCAKNVTVNATVTDCCNNTFSDTVGNITIDHTLPVVTITSPAVDSCVSGNLTVSANVTDNCTCVDNVTFEYSLDGGNWTQIGFNDTQCSANTTCTRSVPWNTTALGADYCNVTIRVNATDCCGNANSTTVGNITINNDVPIVSWNYPTNNTCVNGNITLNVTAGGAPNVTQVEFFYLLEGGNWTSIGTNATACPCNNTCNYTQAWNTTALSDACNVTLRAMATDGCGVTNNATVTNITINNAVPTVNLTAPAADTCVNGTVTLNATAGGAPNITRVDFYYMLEGDNWTSIGNDTTACPCNSTCNYTQAWDTTALGADYCNVTLRAMATDRCGVTNNATVGNISVNNDVPTVNLTAPLEDSCVSGIITLNATAGGAPNVTQVDFYWYNTTSSSWELIGTNSTDCPCNTTCPYTVTWNTTANITCACNVAIKATAIDWCGNSSSHSYNISIDNSGQGPVISITSPQQDECIEGNYTVSANVSDNCTCVANVTFEYFNGTAWNPIGQGYNNTNCTCNTTCNYSIIWDTTTVPDMCNVTVRVNATDCCNLNRSSTVTNITINNDLPIVSWNYPANNDCVNGTVTLNVTAGGAPNVTQVEFFYLLEGGNWTSIGNDTTDCPCNTTCTYTQAWNTTLLSDACNVTLRAMATDWCDVTNNATVGNITINNAVPTVSWNYPTNNTCVNGTVTLNATAGGAPNITQVDFYYLLEGGNWTFIGTNTTVCPCNTTCIYTQVWNTTALGADYCNVTLRAMATDGCSVTNNATVGNITINNYPPIVNLTVPAEGSCVHGNVTLNATAGGAPNVTRVDFYWLNGTNWELIGTDSTDCACGGSCNYSVSWDTTLVPDSCNVTINATATDWCGQTNSSYYNVTVHNVLNAPVRHYPPNGWTITQNNVTFNWTVPGLVVNPTYTLVIFEKNYPENTIIQEITRTGCEENQTITTYQTLFDDYWGWYVNVTDTCGEQTLTNSTFNTTNPKWLFEVHGGYEGPAVAVKAPNGGETWEAGSNHTITWSAIDDVTPTGSLVINLYYSSDGGTNWTSIATNETNDGGYLWTVNNTISNMCLVKVTATDANGNVGLDTSDDVFSIVAALQTTLTVELTAPDEVTEGDSFIVTAIVTNEGQQTATNVNATIQLAGDAGLVANVTNITAATIAAGDQAKAEWRVNCTGGEDANIAVTAVGNNTNTAIASVAVKQIAISPYLVVEVSAPAQVTEGDSFIVTAIVTNEGQQTATNVNATIQLAGDAGLAANQTGLVNITAAAIAAGDQAKAEWRVNCTGGEDANIAVTAVGNNTNTAIASVAVEQIAISPYLTVEISAPSQPVLEGTNFTVTALITNIGGTADSNVTVTMNATGDAIPASEVKPVIASIGAGDSTDVEFALQCTGETDVNVVVTAVGTNTAQDSAAVTQIAITEPYLTVAVSAPSQPVLEGTNFTVTALIKNIGGTADSNVTVTMNATGDAIPASDTATITSIGAGNSTDVEFELQCTGETDVNVVVTAVGTNTAQDSASVTQIAITEPYLTVAVSAPEQVNAGQSYYVTAVITNWGGEAATNVNATISINGTAELTTVGTETSTIGTIGAGSSAFTEWQLTCTAAGGVNVAVTAQGDNTNIATASAAVRQIPAPCDVWVSIPDAAVGNTSNTVTVPINITGVSELASATIWLHYNSSVVWVANVTNGDLGNVTYSMDNATGLTKMAWFSATGNTGDFVFAYVTLKAVGSRGETSPLNLEVKVLTDTAGDDIACCVDDGVFRIGLMEGDVTLDGHVTIVDAMFIAQWVIGSRTLSADQLECADTFDDGSPDIADAMHIAQWVVDPTGSLGVLLVPLWDPVLDAHMIPPQS